MSENKSPNVIFRRIHGRLVPIRLNGQSRERVKGASLVAGGVGVAVAGGNLYRKAVLSSAQAGFKGFQALDKAMTYLGPRQMSFNDIPRRAAQAKKASEFLRKGARLASLSKFVRKSAPAIGAAMIGVGTLKIASTFQKDKKSKMSPELIAGGSAAAGVFAPKAYQYAMKAFDAGVHGRQGAFNFAKSNWAAAAPKLKDLATRYLKAKAF